MALIWLALNSCIHPPRETLNVELQPVCHHQLNGLSIVRILLILIDGMYCLLILHQIDNSWQYNKNYLLGAN